MEGYDFSNLFQNSTGTHKSTHASRDSDSIIKKLSLDVESRHYDTSLRSLVLDIEEQRVVKAPYFHRSFQWNPASCSYFIETILLGFPTPSIVTAKFGTETLLIDGLQRVETIYRFLTNKFALKKESLKKLKNFGGYYFADLPSDIAEFLEDYPIHKIEVELKSEEKKHTSSDFDLLAKSLYRRYNLSTKLRTHEIEDATFEQDLVTKVVKSCLEENSENGRLIRSLFANNGMLSGNRDEISRILRVFRFSLVSDLVIPSSANKIESIKQLLESRFLNYSENEILELVVQILKSVKKVIQNTNTIVKKSEVVPLLFYSYNKLKNAGYELNDYYEEISAHIDRSSDLFRKYRGNLDSSINNRFREFFQTIEIEEQIKILLLVQESKTEQTSKFSLESTHSERSVNKRFPTRMDKSIRELLKLINDGRIDIRPSYQRKETITRDRSSKIIESILLNFPIPPIYAYKNQDRIEIVDGQQRLLTFVGFTNQIYHEFSCNTSNPIKPKISNFKLTNLEELRNLNGLKFSKLSPNIHNKLLDYNITFVQFERDFISNAEKIDLFIRINNRPTSIQLNSYNDWKTLLDEKSILLVEETARQFGDWFFIQKFNRNETTQETIIEWAFLFYCQENDEKIGRIEPYGRIGKLQARFMGRDYISVWISDIQEAENGDGISRYIERVIGLLNDLEKVLFVTFSHWFKSHNSIKFDEGIGIEELVPPEILSRAMEQCFNQLLNVKPGVRPNSSINLLFDIFSGIHVPVDEAEVLSLSSELNRFFSEIKELPSRSTNIKSEYVSVKSDFLSEFGKLEEVPSLGNPSKNDSEKGIFL